jgi:hypothetical protein
LYDTGVSEPPVSREEARAALEARRELGPTYEDELVDQFARRVEARLKEDWALVRRAGEQNTAIVIVSLVVAIPLVAIAGGTSGVYGVALVCLALVLVNYLARR